ncbi:hypothetical protein EIP86_003407 [Pleurotus ostreatoroseus]|nr:hypothetical protein EIP86_003407 [Pleurotus ostreatoroseus]
MSSEVEEKSRAPEELADVHTTESTADLSAKPSTDIVDSTKEMEGATADVNDSTKDGSHVNQDHESTAEDKPKSPEHAALDNIDTDLTSLTGEQQPTPIAGGGPTSPSSALDSLLSPKDPETRFSTRESVAASDVTDDDTRFSTVPLSARQSLDTVHISGDDTGSSKEPNENRQTLDGNDIVRMVHQNRTHKKTASTSTIMSANNVPFILSHVGEDEQSRRSSQDGVEKLKEEFGRRLRSQEAETVDWGTLL